MKQTIWGAKQVHVGYCRTGAAAGFLVNDGLDAGGPWDVDERGARVQLRSAGGALQARAAAERCDEVDAAFDDNILRIKGTVVATRLRDAHAHAAAPVPPPSPSFEVQVKTAANDLWVEPFFVSVVLKPRQMQTLGQLSAMSSAPGPDNSLQSACARGDAALLQVNDADVWMVAVVVCMFL